MPAQSPYAIELSGQDRSYLERLARPASAAHRIVMRAKIVLAVADGASNAAAAPAGLADRKRSGRPKTYGPADQLAIVATATQQVPEADSHWSHRLLAAALDERIGISAAQIGRDCSSRS